MIISFAATAVLGLALLSATVRGAYAQQPPAAASAPAAADAPATPAKTNIPRSWLFSIKEAELIQRVVRERRPLKEKGVKTEEELSLGPDLRPIKKAQADQAKAKARQSRVEMVLQTKTLATLHLPAIMYFNSKKWTIWLNGTVITPNRIPPYLQDIKVSSGSVELSLRRGEGLEPIRVRLRSNETYIIGTGDVIQGPPPAVRTASDEEGEGGEKAAPGSPFALLPQPAAAKAAAPETKKATATSSTSSVLDTAAKALETLKALTGGAAK